MLSSVIFSQNEIPSVVPVSALRNEEDYHAEPTWKATVVESNFNKFAGINSRLATVLGKSFHHGGFLAHTSELSAFLQKVLNFTT